MEHDITVRRMNFGFPEAIDPVILPGQPEESFVYMGISAILPYLEPYLIRSMKSASGEIRDPVLKEQVRRFIGQEGQHYRQHIAFNKAAGLQGVAAVRALEQGIAATYTRYTKTRSLRFNLAYAEGFEAATTALGLAAFEINLFDEMNRRPAELWSWHLVEELEHRTVAFDVYEHVAGDYWYRLAVSLFVHCQLTLFSIRVSRALFQANPGLLRRFGGRAARWRRIIALIRKLGRHAAPRVLRTYRRTYSPHEIELPAGIIALARRFSEQAVKVS